MSAAGQSENIPAADGRGRAIDWKLLFSQLFALEIKKEYVLTAPADGEAIFERLLNAFVQYSPGSFNDVIDAAMAAANPAEAHRARTAFYEHPVGRALIRDLDFSRSIGADVRKLAPVDRFLSAIEANQRRPIGRNEGFFSSPEGENLAAGFAYDGADDDQRVALVMVPGYAAHTIKFCIFDEIVVDANRFHGRPRERPLLRADGIDLDFEDHATFYGRGRGGQRSIDILHPAGKELGNTTGRNRETTDLIREWVDQLPEAYRDTKLIFLGYSKGAPIVLDMVNRHPDLSERTLGYVTHAGVVQGTNVARLILEQAEDILRDVPIGQFIERLRAEDPTSLARVVSPLFAHLDLSWISLPRIRAVFDVLGYDIAPYERQVDRILGGREVRELLDGAIDMAPAERVRWNLKYLDDDTFSDPAFIFNLSALTDIADLVRPVDLERGGEVGPSLLAPTLTATGEVDWSRLSLDALFLYFSSMEGFKNAPGGLYDTQVDLANTKTLHLDRRPLADSLSAAEIADLWADDELRDVLARNQVTSVEALAETPRRELIEPANRANVDAIDLGEFRGHHWSLFEQALRPPAELSSTHAVWSFPRKAYMRALLQVMALHNLVSERHGGGRQ